MSNSNLNYTELLAELNQLSKMATLAQDPLQKGFEYFNVKYSEIQAARERVLEILLQALWNRAELDAELSMVKQEYSQAYSRILVRDDVKPLKSADLRDAVANNELIEYISKIERIERERIIADAFYRNVVLVYEDLKDKNDNINQQLLTVRSMLNINSDLRDFGHATVKQQVNQ